MPFLEKILSQELQGPLGLFDDKFKNGLKGVYQGQNNPLREPGQKPTDPHVGRFLANTTKVGWQADRTLWQGSGMQHKKWPGIPEIVSAPPNSEVGVVPIFGGISWTDHEIVQIWYPSTGYHNEKGVLTGAYNFGNTAYKWGQEPVQQRLDWAREGASLFGKKFGKGLEDGVAIAWQNIPYIKGGWAYWQSVDDAVTHFNNLSQGTGVRQGKAKRLSAPCFFVVGDQLSSLPGWQEGAIASALRAITRLTNPRKKIDAIEYMPDTRLMVEGV